MRLVSSIRARPLLLVVTTIVLLLSAGCSGGGPGGGSPNVLLITLDTTRADRLGCYGYVEARTPVLDALAASGARFESAFSQVPLTLPSHASLLTGTYPGVNGIHVNGSASLGAALPTLAEPFQENGYRTAAFVSSFVLHRVFGLSRGFDHYDDDLAGSTGSSAFETQRPANLVTDSALGWLSEDSGQPFFAWVHYYDPHVPYEPPQEYRGGNSYDGEIAFVDAQVGRLVAWLESAGLDDNTLIVVVGDHGESFDEHREPQHGLFVYDTTMRVPLIASWPGRISPRVVTDDVRLVDVYPTVLDLMGWEMTVDVDERSLVPALSGEALPELPVYGESLYARLGYGWAPLRFLADSEWKFILAPDAELYDRNADPGETRNVIGQHPDVADEMSARLVELESRMVPVETGDVALDGAALDGLRSLGYVGGGGTSDASDDEFDSLRDPKEMIEVYRGHYDAIRWIQQGRLAEGTELLERLVAQSPESDEMYESLGSAYLNSGRPTEAQQAYEESLRASPGHPMRLWGLAESYRQQNKFSEAIGYFLQALEGRPDLGEAHRGLTVSYANTGNFRKAYEHGRLHVETSPTSVNALINLANICLTIGKPEEAAEALERTLTLEPGNTMAHYSLWEALLGTGRPTDALDALHNALAAMPGDIELSCAKAWVLSVSAAAPSGGGAEALELARRCSGANPANARGHDVLAAAHAANGDFDSAVASINRALELAGGPAGAQLRPQFEGRLLLYRSGKPFRQ